MLFFLLEKINAVCFQQMEIVLLLGNQSHQWMQDKPLLQKELGQQQEPNLLCEVLTGAFPKRSKNH